MNLSSFLLTSLFGACFAAENRRPSREPRVRTGAHLLDRMSSLSVIKSLDSTLRKTSTYDVSVHGGQLRQRELAKELTCEEKLAQLEAATEQPKYLMVQIADACMMQKTSSGNIVLKSKHFHPDTELFSDRPFQYETTMKTSEFFETFDERFKSDDLGMPNAAVTLVQDGSHQDVVVSAFIKAVIKDKDTANPTYVYKLEQSDEQKAVVSLEDVMKEGKAVDNKATFDYCSIFIDTIDFVPGGRDGPPPPPCPPCPPGECGPGGTGTECCPC